jgi:hypothetical protein
MIDINLDHADSVAGAFNDEVAEHYRYDKELNALDFKDETQALYAIRKWVLPDIGWTDIGRYLRKEACRFELSRGLPLGDGWLPGISGDAQFNRYDRELYRRESPKVYLLLWHEVFKEPFVKADLKQYRQRVDLGFRNSPDVPELWGEPEYKPWPFSLDA